MSTALHLITLRLRRTWHVMVIISAFATALGALWWRFDLLSVSDSERNAYDDGVKKFTAKPWFPWGQAKQSEDVVIIAIDDQSFADIDALPYWRGRYGAWPYDRLIYADVIQYLKSAGARALIYDATMDQPQSDASGDQALRDTLRSTGLPFYLGFNFTSGSARPPRVEAVNHPPDPPPLADVPEAGPDEVDQFPPDADATAPQAGALTQDGGAPDERRLLQMAGLYAFPVEARGGLTLPTIEAQPGVFGLPDGGQELGTRPKWPVPAMQPVLDSVTGWGVVLHESDEDGKMRHTWFAYTDGVNSYVTLPVAVAADLFHARKVIVEPGTLTIGDRTFHIDRDGSAWIDFGGTLQQRFRTISLADVLRSISKHQLDSVFKDKLVILGGFALGTGDSKATPLERDTPGVVKQAATLDNLLHEGFITDAPFALSLLLTFFVCLLSTALVLIVRNSFVDIGWPVALYLGFFLVTGSFLILTHVHVLSALPSLAGSLASVLATTWERIFADKQRDQLKEMFRFYMESDLVELMVEQHQLPKLDGEVKRITAFFSDIKGFSTFSEVFRDDPKGLMRLLNRYLSAVTPALTQQGACIDKYIGDAVVALFGAPVTHADHALRACKGALEVQQVLARLRVAFKAEGLPDVYTRIGLNTDDLLVGNIGSAQLLDYTAIGDGMNLAARLEGANKVYGTLILMGENTWREVKEQVVAREVDQVRVAGKHIAVRIYELLGLAGEVPEARLRLLPLYADALTKYRARDFEGALKSLDQLQALDPVDGPSRTLRHRSEEFLKQAPPPDWDGVADLDK